MNVSATPPKPKGKRMTNARLAVMVNVLTFSAIGLGLGLIGPCMTIVPSAGEDLDVWVRLFEPDDLEPKTYSILGGSDVLRNSAERGSTLVAALLFAFSVVFPTLKLAVMAWGAAALRLGVRPHAAVKLTSHLGKFSMLEVMVLGLLVLATLCLANHCLANFAAPFSARPVSNRRLAAATPSDCAVRAEKP